jgi:hypothetical protein
VSGDILRTPVPTGEVQLCSISPDTCQQAREQQQAVSALQQVHTSYVCTEKNPTTLEHWCSKFYVRVAPNVISLQLCTPKVVGA